MMAGMFGRSAAVRDKALANPQQYVPGYAGPTGSPGVIAQDAPALLSQGGPELFRPKTTETPPANLGPALDIPSNMFAAKIKPHFFDREGTGTKIIQALGDLSTYMGAAQGQPWALHQLQMQERQAEAARENEQWMRRYQMQRSDKLADDERARNAPRYFSGKEDQLSYDPATGSVSTIYDAPEEYEAYAKALGYQPGSPEYRGALTDYVLRGYGPTAAGVRSDLQSQRLEGQTSLEAFRQRNRLALKQTPGARPRGNGYGHSGGTVGTPRTTGNVYAPILDKVARGIPLSAGEQKVLEMRGGRRSAGSSTAPTATGPGGKKVQWNGSAWVPVN